MSESTQRCPYGDCSYEGTQDEVDEHCAYMAMDEHCAYMAMIDDEEHQQERRVR